MEIQVCNVCAPSEQLPLFCCGIPSLQTECIKGRVALKGHQGLPCPQAMTFLQLLGISGLDAIPHACGLHSWLPHICIFPTSDGFLWRPVEIFTMWDVNFIIVSREKLLGGILLQSTGHVDQTAGRAAVLWKSQLSWDAAPSLPWTLLLRLPSEAVSCSSSAPQADYVSWTTL